MNHCELGRLGELYCADTAARLGAVVSKGKPADLIINGTPVEVKTARLSHYRRERRKGYQFCLHRQKRHGVRAPFVVCLCWGENVDPAAYVIPTEEFNGHRKITIPNDPGKYKGRWAKWCDRWELIA